MVDDCTPRHGEIRNTDVANYYGSINLDLLEKQLRDLGCPPADVRMSMSIFENWQARDGLKGLPVALDSSSVLGTAFLRDVDVELERRRIIHGRWVDDIAMVGAAREVVGQAHHGLRRGGGGFAGAPRGGADLEEPGFDKTSPPVPRSRRSRVPRHPHHDSVRAAGGVIGAGLRSN